jgi:esterase/lipase superfamily enzyme
MMVGRSARIASVVLLAFGVGACAGRPDPALRVIETAVSPDAAKPVTVLAVTTRRESADPGLRFSGERTLRPRFAEITISVPKKRPAGEIQWPRNGDDDPAAIFATRSFEALDKAGLTERLTRQRKRHVLVFVHGYNTRFDEAVFRLAQIVHDSGADVTPVLFSWASWAKVAAYPYDRESASLARDGLETLLDALARSGSVGQVSVLAHSMGGWLTLETLRQMVIRSGSVPTKISDVMLASPDVDTDSAAALSRTLQTARHKPNVTLFVSTDDKALRLSRWVWGSQDRLGAINPAIEPYKSGLERAGVRVVDLSAETSGDPLNHGKFAESAVAVKLIGRQLAKGQSFDGDAGTGDPIGLVVRGTVRAAETVLTAPLNIGETPAQTGLDH